jgi:hypothetical protein
VKRAANVVIGGGGIQGLSQAYHLTGLGQTDGCLGEMNTLGNGSSGWSIAIIDLAFQISNYPPLTQRFLATLTPCREKLSGKHTMHRGLTQAKVGIQGDRWGHGVTHTDAAGPTLPEWSMYRKVSTVNISDYGVERLNRGAPL